MNVSFTFEGGHGEAFSFEGGERLGCVVSRAFAPGAPVELTLVLDGVPVTLRGKSGGSRRREDGRYGLTLRLLNLRREHREALRAALPG